MNTIAIRSPNSGSDEYWPKRPLTDVFDEIKEIRDRSILDDYEYRIRKSIPYSRTATGYSHEGIGIVSGIGSGVPNCSIGDKALISSIPSNWNFGFGRRNSASSAENDTWIVGHMLEPLKSVEPKSDKANEGSTHSSAVPPKADSAIKISSGGFLLTGYECGVLNGLIKPGDSVAIVGSGRIGIAALLTVQFYSPVAIYMVDPNRYRLAMALALGATKLVRSDRAYPVAEIARMTGGRGVDVAIDTIGIRSTLEICKRMITTTGAVARMGAQRKSIDLHLEMQWLNGLDNASGLGDAIPSPLQLKTIIAGRLRPFKPREGVVPIRRNQSHRVF